MLHNEHLDAIIARETFAEILATLTPKQLAVVAMLLDGLPQQESGEILGLTRNCAYERLRFARGRIKTRFPHVTTLLECDS